MIENICICIYLPHDHNYKNLQKMYEEMVRRPKGIYKAYINYPFSITTFQRWQIMVTDTKYYQMEN